MSLSPPTQITVPFATGGLKNAIPAAANPTDGHAGYDVGFPAVNMTPKTAGGIPPFGQDFNGIFFEISTALQYLEAGGNFPYSSAFSTAVGGYPKGCVVSTLAQDGLWINLVANNSTNPDTGGAGWARVGSGGEVGASRNVRMVIAAASASAAMTADEIIVKASLGGINYCIPSFSKTINLATTGAGGMDTGAAPASGYVAIYAIYNPLTGVSALLGFNATSVTATEIYSGANMPAGYTASALVSVWPTTAGGLLVIGGQNGRRVLRVSTPIISTSTPQAAFTSVSISGAVPRNAKSAKIIMSTINTATNTVQTIDLASDASGSGQQSATGGIVLANNGAASTAVLDLITLQTIFYRFANVGGGTPTFTSAVTGYEF